MQSGLEILAFPCNQFAGQEPGSNEEIQETVCSRFKAEFPIFDKVSNKKFNYDLVYLCFTPLTMITYLQKVIITFAISYYMDENAPYPITYLITTCF